MAYGSINVPGLDKFDLLGAYEKAIPEGSDFLLGVEGEELIRVPADAVGGGGKRTCIVIGTSTAGWTEKDCDYLCDGTDDQVEIQAALTQAIEQGKRCNVIFLAGDYNITEFVEVDYNSYTCENLIIEGAGNVKFHDLQSPAKVAQFFFSRSSSSPVINPPKVLIKGVTFEGYGGIRRRYNPENMIQPDIIIDVIDCVFVGLTHSVDGAHLVRNCFFINSKGTAVYSTTKVYDCTFLDCAGTITANFLISFGNNFISNSPYENTNTAMGSGILAVNNYISGIYCGFYNASVSASLLSGNRLKQCTRGIYLSGVSESIVSNNIITDISEFGIQLYAATSHTQNNLITGNTITPKDGTYTSSMYSIWLRSSTTSSHEGYVKNNLISENMIFGKNYVVTGRNSGNTFVNNKYN